MSNCQEYCLSCQSIQEFKVNVIQVHGVCRTHLSYNSEIYKCIHCECIVPITIISALDSPESYYSKQSIYTASTQKSIPQPCDYCFNKSTLSDSTCHNICQECFKDKCPLCHLEEDKIIACENCGNICNTSKLQCGHQVCINCHNNGCDLCKFLSCSISLKKTVPNECEYCLDKVFSITCDMAHRLCKDCYSEYCPLCSRFSLRPTFCEVCKDNKIQTNCEKGHSLCIECAKECVLCTNDLFSVIEPSKKGSVFSSIVTRNGIENVKISGTGNDGKGEEMASVDDSANEDKKVDGVKSLTKHYVNELENYQEENTRKNNKNGSESCRNCILF